MNMTKLHQYATHIQGNICLSDHKDEHLQVLLNIARFLGRPLYINSAYRTADANVKVGGSPTSSHLKGLAFDIRCKTPKERYELLSCLLRYGVHRIGIYATFVHIDFDSAKPPCVCWLSLKK